MEFSVKKCGGLAKALKEANKEANGDPKQNIVILDMDCDKKDYTDASDTVFDYIRIKGKAGVRRTIKNYGFQCKGDVYLENINVERTVKPNATGSEEGNNSGIVDFYGSDTFIRWNYEKDADFANSSIYIDNVNVSRYRLFVYEPSPTQDSVTTLSKIRMKNCTFKNCFGSMLRLYSRCDDAKVYGNTYIEPYVPDNLSVANEESGTEPEQAAYVHVLAMLGSSSQESGEYSRYPINNVEVFDNVMIGTYQKDGEDCIKNIYYYKLDDDGKKKKSETHLCCLHGDNINVHDNLYRGWEMMDPTQEVGSEPIYIKGSNIKVIRNTIEDCTMGEGAITLKGAHENVEIAYNKINPGYEVEQKMISDTKDSTYSLILLQSFGGKEPDSYGANAKIHSNHLIYKRKAVIRNSKQVFPNCKSAIFFNSVYTPEEDESGEPILKEPHERDFYDKKISAEVYDNYYEGISDFIRCAQESKDVKMVVDNNIVFTTGIIPGYPVDDCCKSSLCSSALVSAGVKDFDNNLNVQILRNRGNVGVVYINDYGKEPTINEQMKTNVHIAENNMLTKLIFLSTPADSDGNVDDQDKNILISVMNNNFTFLDNKQIGYAKAYGCGTIRSNNADIIISGNMFEFSSGYEPYDAFTSNHGDIEGLNRVIKCRSINVINNVFKTSNVAEYSNTQFVCRGAFDEDEDVEKYFIYYRNESEDFDKIEDDTHIDSGNVVES